MFKTVEQCSLDGLTDTELADVSTQTDTPQAEGRKILKVLHAQSYIYEKIKEKLKFQEC